MSDQTKYADVIGFDNLVIAEVTEDSEAGYVTGEVKKLMPAGELSKTSSQDAANKYYDNALFSTRRAAGPSELTASGAKIPSKVLAQILGDYVDESTGIAIDDGEPKDKKYALGYRLMYEDNTYKYIWLLNCAISRPDEAAKTLDESTDSNNTELAISASKTVHKFTYPDGTSRAVKEVYCDERDGLADYSKWFETVVTPETLPTKTA